jgi:hypothetical protein
MPLCQGPHSLNIDGIESVHRFKVLAQLDYYARLSDLYVHLTSDSSRRRVLIDLQMLYKSLPNLCDFHLPVILISL